MCLKATQKMPLLCLKWNGHVRTPSDGTCIWRYLALVSGELSSLSSFHHTINYPKEKENTKNLQVLPGEVERLDWPVPSTLQGISEIHDSREVVRNNIGWIHVVKDEAQILPYCILQLTEGGGQFDNASNAAGPSPGSQGHNPNSAGTPTGLMDNSQGPREQQN